MSASLLGACSDLIASNKPPILQPPPVQFEKPCERPVRLPERELTQLEVEQFWMRDRVNLAICGNQLLSLRDFYKLRDGMLTGDRK